MRHWRDPQLLDFSGAGRFGRVVVGEAGKFANGREWQTGKKLSAVNPPESWLAEGPGPVRG